MNVDLITPRSTLDGLVDVAGKSNKNTSTALHSDGNENDLLLVQDVYLKTLYRIDPQGCIKCNIKFIHTGSKLKD